MAGFGGNKLPRLGPHTSQAITWVLDLKLADFKNLWMSGINLQVIHILDNITHCHHDIIVAEIGPLHAEEIEYVFSEEEKHIICEEFKVVKEIHR